MSRTQDHYLSYVTEAAARLGMDRLSDRFDWSRLQLAGPQQRNGCDCGYMSLITMEQIVRARARARAQASRAPSSL
jgi:Ulp1 family protease